MANMADNYYKTAENMHKDSGLLHKEKRWQNACYLGGYVVETGLKAIAERSGVCRDKLIKKIGHNLRSLENLVDTARITVPGKGILDIQSITNSDLYDKWSPVKRYDPDAWNNEQLSLSFQQTAKKMMDHLTELQIDGERN